MSNTIRYNANAHKYQDTNNNHKKVSLKSDQNIPLYFGTKDSLTLNQESSAESIEKTTSNLKEEIKKTKEKQGPIGKLWDGFKNITGIGAGSKKALKAISDFENGKITKEQLLKNVEKYKDGQKQCVDMISDIVSGIVSFGAFSLATGIGIAASPLTGGASLGLVGLGFGIAGFAGSLSKIAIKGIDCAIGKRKYDSFGYDLATGGINGVFAPITAGIGGAVGKTVARKVGVTALREGGEIAIKEGIKGSAKGMLTKTLLTTNVKYVGGTMGARALALGADMAVNGAISGAVDSGTRYAAGDNKNKSLEGFMQEVTTGGLTGLIMSPIIGGGMRLAGNGIGKLTGKLEKKVNLNYEKAKSAMMNTPTTESTDMEIIKGFGDIIEEAQNIVNEYKLTGDDALGGLDKNVLEVKNSIKSIIENATTINNEVGTLSKENKELITEILNEIAEGKDVSSKIAKLAQKGISITDIIDKKIETLTKQIDEKLGSIINNGEVIEKAAKDRIETLAEVANKAQGTVEKAKTYIKEIPNTNAYQQLGELPERTRGAIEKLKGKFQSLNEAAQSAKEKIKSGNIEDGVAEFTKYYNELHSFQANLEEQITAIQKSADNSGMSESASILRERLSKLMSSPEFQAMTREEQAQAIIENSNILLSKFAQTFSGTEGLPQELSDLLKKFTSNCNVSRTLDEAQTLADELYGAGKYTLQKSFGAGTIGETYLAKTTDGKDVVVKMLKEGVTPEKFAEDRAMFTRYIEEFVTDSAEKEYKLNLINGMFDAWDRELNFSFEAQGAKNMAKGAKRFNVCQTLELGTQNGRNISLVMEKANGVRLDDLLEMAEFYRKNPAEYLSKYSKEIEANPALKNPDKWMKELGVTFQKAQNEQIMFTSKSGTRTIHADPHTGNVFVEFDAKTSKPKITYIDTGNVVERTSAETLEDICLSLNMMIGNSKGVANAMLEGATLPEGASKGEIAEKFAKMLDEKLYKAGVNLKSTQYTQNTINEIMKELNVVPSASNSNLMKATLQRIETSRAINRACGTNSNKITDIKDLTSGIMQSFKVDKKGTIKKIIPIMKWAYKNDDQAMQTFFQMIIKNGGVEV